MRTAVRIVLDRFHDGGNSRAVAAKVNDAIKAFVTGTATAHGNDTTVVATGFFIQALGKRLVRFVCGQLGKIRRLFITLGWRERPVSLQWHCVISPAVTRVP